MKKIQILTLLIGFFVLFSCKNNEIDNEKSENSDVSETSVSENVETFGIVIHGGAGTIRKKNMSDSLE